MVLVERKGTERKAGKSSKKTRREKNSPSSSFKNNFKTEKTWKVLEDAIHEINNHNASGLSFEELYR